VEKSGSWFNYRGERVGQGRENARQYLKDHVDVRVRLETELRTALGLAPANGPAASGEPKRATATTAR